MEKQQTFASAAWARKGKVTRRERFLAAMDAVIPWSRLVALIEPYPPNTGKGRPPHDLERMLRIYFLPDDVCGQPLRAATPLDASTGELRAVMHRRGSEKARPTGDGGGGARTRASHGARAPPEEPVGLLIFQGG